MDETFRLFLASVFAGIYISLGGCVYLAQPIIGAIFFAFGIICIIKQNLKLYTGMAGFISFKLLDISELLCVLFGNFMGTFCGACIGTSMKYEFVQKACEIISTRIDTPNINIFMLAIGCGIIMSVAVFFAKRNESIVDWFPLLFGIPLFIYCGFVHCIADSFYFFMAFSQDVSYISYIPKLCIAILGNFVGCNLYRALIVKQDN